jgi:hypothetical protein
MKKNNNKITNYLIIIKIIKLNLIKINKNNNNPIISRKTHKIHHNISYKTPHNNLKNN